MESTNEVKRKKLISNATFQKLQGNVDWFQDIKNAINTAGDPGDKALKFIGTCRRVGAIEVENEITKQFPKNI
jgi:hypothetical protein